MIRSFNVDSSNVGLPSDWSFRDSDREIARSVLKAFISPLHTRRLLKFEQILLQAAELGNPGDLRRVLNALISQRLIRVARMNDHVGYELPHGYMISHIDQWLSEQEREHRRVRDIMTYEAEICQYMDTLIPMERARYLDSHSGQCDFSPQEVHLIHRSIESAEAENRTRIDLERQFLHAQKMEAVGRLAGGVAHDFSNLLMVIKSCALFVRQSKGNPEKTEKYVDQIEDATTIATSVTRQLLMFSRRQHVERNLWNVNHIISDLGKMLPRLLGEDIELRMVLAPDLEPIFVDRGHIEQILMDLAVNSRDAMPNGGKLVVTAASVEVNRQDDPQHENVAPGRYVSLAVTDTGIGMDRVKLPRNRREAIGSEKRVLIVEDESALRDVLGDYLSGIGYIVLKAANGHEASQKPIDILLTDLVMPGMQGREVAVEVMGQFPKVQIVFMAGYGAGSITDFAEFVSGRAKLLNKPFDMTDLAEILG